MHLSSFFAKTKSIFISFSYSWSSTKEIFAILKNGYDEWSWCLAEIWNLVQFRELRTQIHGLRRDAGPGRRPQLRSGCAVTWLSASSLYHFGSGSQRGKDSWGISVFANLGHSCSGDLVRWFGQIMVAFWSNGTKMRLQNRVLIIFWFTFICQKSRTSGTCSSTPRKLRRVGMRVSTRDRTDSKSELASPNFHLPDLAKFLENSKKCLLDIFGKFMISKFSYLTYFRQFSGISHNSGKLGEK